MKWDRTSKTRGNMNSKENSGGAPYKGRWGPPARLTAEHRGGERLTTGLRLLEVMD